MKNLTNHILEIENGIKTELLSIKQATESTLYSAIDYAIMGGGKRVRPMLMLLSADTLGMHRAKILPFAVALECIHTYSLIHDDLPSMDNDDYRRGKPTVHKVYGEAVAVLAGDALLNLAYEIMLKACIQDNDLITAAADMAKAAGVYGMVGGQAIDISKTNYNKDEILAMYSGKTGALITAAITVPYIAANSDNLLRIRELAGYIGQIFQLVDDLHDFHNGEDTNKITFVTLFGEKETLEFISQLTSKIFQIFTTLNLQHTALCEYTEALSHRLT